MTVRKLKKTDVQPLQAMHKASGFDYPFPDLTTFEDMHVVVDDRDRPIAAAGAECILQLYMFAAPEAHALVLKAAVQMLHESLAASLREKGYHEVNAFLPPEIADSFGRRLMRTWQWAKNWPSYCIRF